jgi:hypothetical protein
MLRALICALALLCAACDTAPPPNLDLARTRSTEHHLYKVQIAPVAPPIVINKMHAWEIRVSGPKGEPVEQAAIAVSGGMPQHGHGLPTAPRVTRVLGPGRYLLEGMKFSMSGWWEIELDIRAAAGSDRVKFNTVLPPG